MAARLNLTTDRKNLRSRFLGRKNLRSCSPENPDPIRPKQIGDRSVDGEFWQPIGKVESDEDNWAGNLRSCSPENPDPVRPNQIGDRRVDSEFWQPIGKVESDEDNWAGNLRSCSPENPDPVRPNQIGDRRVDSEFWQPKGKVESDEDGGAEYYIRGRKEEDMYIMIDKEFPRSLWMGDYPPITACYSVQFGSHFLKKTVRINPDDSFTTMVRDYADETEVLVKGEESVCAVARPKIMGLKGRICGSAAPFIFGTEPLGSRDIDRTRRPFASIAYCLDTTKEDLSKEGCGDSPSEQYPEFPCHEDFGDPRNEENAMEYLEKRPSYLKGFGARFDEQKAINYLKDKVKQDRVMGHEETKQAAITAFMYLLKGDCKIDEITAYAVGKGFSFEEALSVEEILKHLAAIPDLLPRVSE